MKILLIFLTLFVGQLAFAEWGEVGRFRAATLQQIDNAQQKGITEVQGVSLSELRNFVKTAPIYYNGHLSMTYGGRRCAAWQPGSQDNNASSKPFILLNKQCADLPDEDLGALGVHESLGLSAGLDRNYEISTVIVNGKAPESKLIDSSKQLQQLKSFNTQKELYNGGSTGVGGGGDFDDLNFKLQGLKYLQNMSDGYVDGIPVDLLEITLRQMKIAPAANIAGLIEFRGRGFGTPKSIVYVAEGVYRSRDYPHLGMVAYLAARVFLLHASDEIGLTLPQQQGVPSLVWESPALQQAVLLIPAEDGKHVVTWRNSALQKEMPPAAYQNLLHAEQLRVQALLQDPNYQNLFQTYTHSIQVELVP